ncbi:magnesium transporter NIPA-domain-containing protein [Lipomyces kononenkoae]
MSDSIGYVPGDGDSPGRSSSIIGISTAIVGNVIISIALNLQRYAHLTLKKRLAEEAEQYTGAPCEAYDGQTEGQFIYHTDDETTSAFRDLERGPSLRSPSQNGYEYDAIPRSQQSTSESPVMPGTPTTDETASLLSKSNEEDVRLDQTNKQGTVWYSVRNVKDNRRGLPRSDTMQSTASVEESTERFPRYMKSGSWWLGIALMAIGETGNFLAYGFAPASTVSPLGVVALISNCIVAPIFFHEQFRLRDFGGVVVAIAGAVTVVLASNPEEEFLDPRRILNAVAQLGFIIYVGVTFFLIAALSVLSNKYGDRLIFIDIALVALFGGYTALSTKAVSSLLSYTLYLAFTFPITYILIFVLVFTAIMQVKYLSRALQRFESTQVIPTHFVFFTISVILGSAILYQDFSGASTAQLVQFGCGCFLTFIGVYLITSNRTNESDDTSKTSVTNVDNSEDSDFFSSVASVNLDRSSGARTPTSFYEEDEDAQEIHDADATISSRTRVHDSLFSNDETTLSGSYPIPSSETNPLLSFLTPSKYGSSPGTSSRSYVPGPAGMGLIMDSVVRDRMKSWQMNQQRRRQGGRSAGGRKRIASKPTTIDTRQAPLYRVQTRGDEDEGRVRIEL